MLRLMIVDDEQIIREALSEMVDYQSIGYELVATAKNGMEALDTIRDEYPDVVVTDIRMPFINGLELIDRSSVSVHEGNEIVRRVSDSLKRVQELVLESDKAIHSIAQAVDQEAAALSQVSEGLGQISSVVQTNSATSEQSAAASEELSSQASLMKDLLSKFRLLSDSTSGSVSYSAAPSYSDDGGDDVYDSGYSSAGGSPFSKY